MKKLSLLSLCLLFTLILTSAMADTSGDYVYEASGYSRTATIIDYKGSEKNVTIPTKLGGYPVVAINKKAFAFCDSIESIVIPDTVTSIGDQAFYSCDRLKSIVIPDGVTFIGTDVFYACRSLTSVSIPVTLTDIGVNPFYYCERLSSIKVPPDHPTLAVIDNVLFEKADKRLVCYPSGLTASKYVIPNGIRIIGDLAFSYCNSLTTLSIPDSVTSVEGGPFVVCRSLREIQVSPEHSTLAVIDGVLFGKTDHRLICYPRALVNSTYAIPQGTLVIGKNAFYECDFLHNVGIPDSVTRIESDAFVGSGLLTLDMPDSVTFIGAGAFQFSTLTSVTISDSVTTIHENTFFYCPSLKSVTLPAGLRSIGNSAFRECVALRAITIPASVSSIGYSSFSCSFGGNDRLTITVTRDSYAHQYCRNNNLNYTFPDANDWLLD